MVAAKLHFYIQRSKAKIPCIELKLWMLAFTSSGSLLHIFYYELNNKTTFNKLLTFP